MGSFLAIMLMVLPEMPATGQSWELQASMQMDHGCYQVAIAAIGTKIYLYGGNGIYPGWDEDHKLDVAQVYDISQGSWSALPEGPYSAEELAGVAVNGKFYVFGGRACPPPDWDCGPVNIASYFDPQDGTWHNNLTPAPVARSGRPAVAVGTNIYLFNGGATGKKIACYHVDSDDWTPVVTEVPGPLRGRLNVAASGGKLYVFGGAWEGPNEEMYVTKESWAYDTATDTWEQLADMPNWRACTLGHALPVIGGKIYLVGGRPATKSEVDSSLVYQSYSSTLVYDIASDSWDEDAMPTLNVPRQDGGLVVVDGALYAVAGCVRYDPDDTETLLTATVERWAPDTQPPVIAVDPDEVMLLLHSDAPDTREGISATDNIDGDVSAKIAVSGDTVDTSRPGDYTVTYDVSDQAGNPAVQCTRTYHVLCQVTAQAGDDGSVLPTQVTMGAQDEQVFTATTNGHYAVYEWHLDGSVVQQGGEQYTLSVPVSNHLLQVSFRVPDDDNDGMPNWWEDKYEMDLETNGDDDGDGIPNIVEYQESLNPTIQDDIDYLILGEGWNLVAVPAAGERATFAAFFDGKAIGLIWAWDHEGQRYEVADDDEIDPKRGLWVYVTDMCGIPLE